MLAGEGEGISIPLIVTGSWSDPKFSLDLEGLVDDKVDEVIDREAERAKRRAERELRRKAREELGLRRGEDIEDRLKEEAEQGLRNLLD